MKKKLALLLVAALAFSSLTGCSLFKDHSNDSAQEESDDKDDKKNDKDDDKDDDDQSLTAKDKDGCVTFTVNVSVPIASDSWIGICEKDEYLYESDADNYDIVYAYPENYYDEDYNVQPGPYTYVLDYSFIDDGSYTLVLTDTDCDGYVIFYAPCKIKDGKFKVNTDELVYNNRPDDLAPIVGYDPFGDDIDGGNWGGNSTTFPVDPDNGNGFSGNSSGNSSSSGNSTSSGNSNSSGSSWDYVRDPLEYATEVTTKLSEEEAVGVSIHNDTLVLKYTGDVKIFGESSLYYVLGGFYEDGEVDWLNGTSRFWYFFDSDAAYQLAFEAAKSNDDLIIKDYNPSSRYFSVIGFFRNDWEYYDDIVEDINNGILPADIPPTPEYIVVQ